MQLVGVGAAPRSSGRAASADARPRRPPGRRPRRRPPAAAAQRRPGAAAARLLALAVGQHVRGQLDGPVQRPLQPRQGLGHLRVGRVGQPLRGDLGAVSMLRRSWLILATASPSAASRARDCSAARSSSCIRASSASARPISSRRPERRRRAAGVLRVGAEPLHGLGDPLHRPHQEDGRATGRPGRRPPREMKAVTASRPQQVAATAPAQRRGRGPRSRRSRRCGSAGAATHPQHPLVAAGEQGAEGRGQPAGGVAAAQVDQRRACAPARGAASSSRRMPSLCTATETTPAPSSSSPASSSETTPAGAASTASEASSAARTRSSSQPSSKAASDGAEDQQLAPA